MNARSEKLETKSSGWLAFGLRTTDLPWFFLLLPLAGFAQSTDKIPPLQPALPEIQPTLWEQYGAIVILLGIVFMAFVALGLWLLLRPRPPVVVPIEIQARRELGTLGQCTEDGRTLSKISRSLRRYIAAAFELPPHELTTAEFCRTIAANEKIGPQLSTACAEFLRQCDERKFAPLNVPPVIGTANRALQLVELSEVRRAELRQAANQTAQRV